MEELNELTRKTIQRAYLKAKRQVGELPSVLRSTEISAERHEADSKNPNASFDDRRFSQERAKAFRASAENTRNIIAKRNKLIAAAAKRLLAKQHQG